MREDIGRRNDVMMTVRRRLAEGLGSQDIEVLDGLPRNDVVTAIADLRRTGELPIIYRNMRWRERHR